MKIYETLADLQPRVGEVIGTSEWLLIDQARIDQFAQATGDDQWIHVDPQRAAQGPFGTTIAHGFLTLSLLSVFLKTAFQIRSCSMGVNYGLNKGRFTGPVPVGSRVRGHFKLVAWEPLDREGAQLVKELQVELEGQTKPVCIAEAITRLYP